MNSFLPAKQKVFKDIGSTDMKEEFPELSAILLE